MAPLPAHTPRRGRLHGPSMAPRLSVPLCAPLKMEKSTHTSFRGFSHGFGFSEGLGSAWQVVKVNGLWLRWGSTGRHGVGWHRLPSALLLVTWEGHSPSLSSLPNLGSRKLCLKCPAHGAGRGTGSSARSSTWLIVAIATGLRKALLVQAQRASESPVLSSREARLRGAGLPRQRERRRLVALCAPLAWRRAPGVCEPSGQAPGPRALGVWRRQEAGLPFPQPLSAGLRSASRSSPHAAGPAGVFTWVGAPELGAGRGRARPR